MMNDEMIYLLVAYAFLAFVEEKELRGLHVGSAVGAKARELKAGLVASLVDRVSATFLTKVHFAFVRKRFDADRTSLPNIFALHHLFLLTLSCTLFGSFFTRIMFLFIVFTVEFDFIQNVGL
jgi:hypothetical protein